MRTVTQFITDNKVTMRCERTDANPYMADERDMDHWKCVLRRPGAQLTTYFSMGYGHKGAAPELAEVLDCLASDSAGTEELFETWCAEYGFDTDSRRAERVYEDCRKQAAKLRRFLGDDKFNALLYGTERY